MIRWLVVRTGQALVTLVIALVILFFLMRLVPGEPIIAMTGERPQSQEETDRIRRRYCLDCPLPVQFSSFLSRAVRGDLGTSIHFAGRPVTQLIREKLPATLLLGGTALVLNFTIGLLLGVWQAVRKGTRVDRVLSSLSLIGYAIPSFWLGLILAWIFAVKLHWLPATSMTDPLLSDPPLLTYIGDVARHLVLPAVTLSVVSIAATMRYQRNAMIEVLRLDYIRTARAKGLSESAVVWRHGWRNALFPVLTLFGLWLPILVTGSVFVEYVFAWSGLGTLATDAIGFRDYPLLMGTAILVSSMIVFGGWLTDVGYMVLDPRVRHR
ncbi:MAG: ABC transporter permease [Gemmatimonadota bacterium]